MINMANLHSMIFFVSRANIGSAKVLGLYTSLRLTDNQYNLALSIFFLGYVVFEVPSNIVVKRIGPVWYIPTMTVGDSAGSPGVLVGSLLMRSRSFGVGFAD
jgi:fucose permease